MFKRIDHVEIAAGNLERSIAFYMGIELKQW
jgi:catechol 2,3-dioxygenase-like lactoylglutathione lyase family enzyme